MKPNTDALQKLLKSDFGDNKAAFAAAIGITRGQISRIINKGEGAGAHFFGGLITYCDGKGIDFRKYIF